MKNTVENYTTLGLVAGLDWKTARRVAEEIMREKERGGVWTSKPVKVYPNRDEPSSVWVFTEQTWEEVK